MSARVMNDFALLSEELSSERLLVLEREEERDFVRFLKLPCVSPEKRVGECEQNILQSQPLSLRVL